MSVKLTPEVKGNKTEPKCNKLIKLRILEMVSSINDATNIFDSFVSFSTDRAR
jgi:hypothetical protein